MVVPGFVGKKSYSMFQEPSRFSKAVPIRVQYVCLLSPSPRSTAATICFLALAFGTLVVLDASSGWALVSAFFMMCALLLFMFVSVGWPQSLRSVRLVAGYSCAP